MKNFTRNHCLLIAFFCVPLSSFAQTLGVNYQAIIKAPKELVIPGENAYLPYLVSSDINIKFFILDEVDAPIYIEEHKTQTNDYGEVNLIIGKGVSLKSDFSQINWDGNLKKLKVEIDYLQGSGYEFDNLQDLLYLPHPLNASDADKIVEHDQLIKTMIKSSGLMEDGTYRRNLGSPFISRATSLSDADHELAIAVNEQNQKINNLSDSLTVERFFLDAKVLTIVQGSHRMQVDLEPLQDGVGTDDQNAVEVLLQQPLDVNNDSELDTTAEMAVVNLKKYIDLMASQTSDDQQLSFDSQTHVLSLEEGGAIDLSPYKNTDAQKANEVSFQGDFDVDADGNKEENVEELIEKLTLMLFACKDPKACNYDSDALFENNDLCEQVPEQGKNCDTLDIAPGVAYQGGFVLSYDPQNQKGLIVAASDLVRGSKNTFDWSCMGIDVSATGSELYSGKGNTQKIIEECTKSMAAHLCNTYQKDGFTDWFLPSSETLKHLYDQKDSFTNTTGFEKLLESSYWSSTQSSSSQAKSVNMMDGTEQGDDKSTSNSVRPVRFITF